MSTGNWHAKGLRAALWTGLLAPVLGAQSLGLPASDPVGISRSGAGVAYGRSLEAAALNPALLTTLLERGGYYVGAGEEFQSTQLSLQSNQKTLYSTDRNRFLPSFGAAWKLGDRGALGVKVDVPFARHGGFGDFTSARFLGDEINLKTLRGEVSLARAFGDQGQFSVGLSAGAMRVTYASGATLRAAVAADPTAPVSAVNPSLGLVETRVRQEGDATVGTFGLGFRWAASPRWTLGFAAQGFLKGTAKLTPSYGREAPAYYGNDGFSTAPLGLPAKAAQLLALGRIRGSDDEVSLPGRASLGLRQRVNNLFTWEADLRFTRTSRMALPSLPVLTLPSGAVVGPGRGTTTFKDAYGLSVTAELQLSKEWVVRGGFSLDQAFREDAYVEHTLAGARGAGFSIGAGYRAWGGELTFGYQVRLAQDQDSTHLDGTWSQVGYRPTGTPMRVESMGHLYAFGFRKAF